MHYLCFKSVNLSSRFSHFGDHIPKKNLLQCIELNFSWTFSSCKIRMSCPPASHRRKTKGHFCCKVSSEWNLPWKTASFQPRFHGQMNDKPWGKGRIYNLDVRLLIAMMLIIVVIIHRQIQIHEFMRLSCNVHPWHWLQEKQFFGLWLEPAVFIKQAACKK